jgi:hypothetical protein
MGSSSLALDSVSGASGGWVFTAEYGVDVSDFVGPGAAFGHHWAPSADL